MNKRSDTKYKIALGEILRGYSVISTKQFKGIHVKHFSLLESIEIEEKYEENFQKAVEKGLPTIEERVKTNIEQEWWTDKKEKEFTKIPIEIGELRAAKSKFFLKRDIEKLANDIKQKEIRLLELETERNELIGYTAETFAGKKTNEFFIYFALRKGDNKTPFFTYEEYDELEESILNDLVKAYNQHTLKFSQEEMKKIAICNSHMHMIYLCGEDLYSFYGKGVTELTLRQTDLYGLGRYFKNIIQEAKGKISDDVLEDPERLVEYVDGQKATENLDTKKSEESSGMAIVGATKEDLKKLGLDKEGNVDSFSQAATEKGGSLTFEEILKLHGL